MSTVFGNIKYIHYYKDNEELRHDINLRLDCYVSVISDFGIQTSYKIENLPRRDLSYIALDNGYFANPVISGNQAIDSMTYSSIRPSDYEVGGIRKGEEFSGMSIPGMFNALLNGSMKIYFTANCGIDPNETYRRGDWMMITSVGGEIQYTEHPVTHYVLTIDGAFITQGDLPDILLGPYSIPLEDMFVISDTTDIRVILSDSVGYEEDVHIIIKYDDPVYYGLVPKGYNPGTPWFQSCSHTYDSSTVFKATYSNESLCVAVPEGKTLKLIDENGLFVTNSYINRYSETEYVYDHTINYTFYIFPVTDIVNWTYTIVIE